MDSLSRLPARTGRPGEQSGREGEKEEGKTMGKPTLSIAGRPETGTHQVVRSAAGGPGVGEGRPQTCSSTARSQDLCPRARLCNRRSSCDPARKGQAESAGSRSEATAGPPALGLDGRTLLCIREVVCLVNHDVLQSGPGRAISASATDARRTWMRRSLFPDWSPLKL